MTYINLTNSRESSSWVIGIATEHNNDHDSLNRMLGIIGITLPELEHLEELSQDKNYYTDRSERESLTLLLSTGLQYLTFNELKSIQCKIWKLTSPDQIHFQTFYPDQVHDHPGLITLSKHIKAELGKRNSKIIHASRYAPIDQLANLLGEDSSLFAHTRRFLRSLNMLNN